MEELRAMLEETRTIAVVGLSPNPDRPSPDIAKCLRRQGYQIIPVNPSIETVLGERRICGSMEADQKIGLDIPVDQKA
jgi:predicted CoA-binding protein